MKPRRAVKTIKRRRIQFSYDDTEARDVAVTGDFNTWHPSSHPMKRNGEGRWQKILMLPPGDYEYKFVVDGQWRTDPLNTDQCPNCYGSLNNRLRVRAEQ